MNENIQDFQGCGIFLVLSLLCKLIGKFLKSG